MQSYGPPLPIIESMTGDISSQRPHFLPLRDSTESSQYNSQNIPNQNSHSPHHPISSHAIPPTGSQYGVVQGDPFQTLGPASIGNFSENWGLFYGTRSAKNPGNLMENARSLASYHLTDRVKKKNFFFSFPKNFFFIFMDQEKFSTFQYLKIFIFFFSFMKNFFFFSHSRKKFFFSD